MADQYIIIPGTQQKVYEGTVVVLHRLPNVKWIIHNGYYNYNGRKQKGWYFSSIPADTTMPVFNEDLVAMTILDDGGDTPRPPYPPGPFPPGPFPPGPYPPGPFPPGPPAPVPIPFTPQDKKQVDAAMITVPTLRERDKLGNRYLIDGKLVRVNDIDGEGTVDYFTWDAEESKWVEATLGYRYMTKEEIEEEISDTIVNIIWSDDTGSLVLVAKNGDEDTTQLTGVVHSPSYDPQHLTLRFPIFGKDDLVVQIPADNYIRSIRFEREYVFPDGSVKPAIVVVVSDGEEERELAGDATGLIYNGSETATTTVIITDDTNSIQTDVKVSALENNRIQINDDGLYVDVSDLEESIADLYHKTDVSGGELGSVVITDEKGIASSTSQIGGPTLSDTDDDLLATEAAVKDAMMWRNFN